MKRARSALDRSSSSCSRTAGAADGRGRRRGAPRRRLRATITPHEVRRPAHPGARPARASAFGYAYAFAEDNICTIADDLRDGVGAQRSRYFGPDGTWTFSGNGSVNDNLSSDFFYERVNRSGIVEDLMSQAPPEGPEPELRKIVARLRGRLQRLPARRRRRAPSRPALPRRRVGPADQGDRRLPPLPPARDPRQLRRRDRGDRRRRAGLAPLRAAAAERRAVRRGRSARRGQCDRTSFRSTAARTPTGSAARRRATARGMVLGNPHFPWDGSERLYQAQLTIPGKLDVSGGSLYGVPAVLHRPEPPASPGRTPWPPRGGSRRSSSRSPRAILTPTSSTASREPMEAIELTVQAKTADGTLESRSRTLYETEYGPMVTSSSACPCFPGPRSRGFALGDVNARTSAISTTSYDNRPGEVRRAYDRIEREIQGIPWVNCIAADRKGHAYYSMHGAIPNVPDAKATGMLGRARARGLPAHRDPDPRRLALGVRLGHRPRRRRPGDLRAGRDPAPDPSRLRRERQRQPLAVQPGAAADGLRPGDRRRGARALAANPPRPGDDRAAARRHRRAARQGLRPAQARPGGARQSPVRGRALARRAGRLLRGQPRRCVGSTGPVDVSNACPVLAAWDLRDDLDSAGADPLPALRLPACSATSNRCPTGVSSGYAPGSEAIFDVPFDPADPVHTPRGLNTANPLVGTGARRRGHRPAGRRHPARRRPARLPVRRPRRQGDPDRRRARNARGLRRDQRPLGSRARATRTYPTARASSPR